MNKANPTFPTAVLDRFYAEEIGNETVVYDTLTHQSHVLNQTAAFVWRRCDGQTSLEAIAEQVSETFGSTDGLAITTHAVGELQSQGLVVPDRKIVMGPTVSRRRILAQAASLGALIPIVAVGQQSKTPKKHRSFVPKRAQKGGSDF